MFPQQQQFIQPQQIQASNIQIQPQPGIIYQSYAPPQFIQQIPQVQQQQVPLQQQQQKLQSVQQPLTISQTQPLQQSQNIGYTVQQPQIIYPQQVPQVIYQQSNFVPQKQPINYYQGQQVPSIIVQPGYSVLGPQVFQQQQPVINTQEKQQKKVLNLEERLNNLDKKLVETLKRSQEITRKLNKQTGATGLDYEFDNEFSQQQQFQSPQQQQGQNLQADQLEDDQNLENQQNI